MILTTPKKLVNFIDRLTSALDERRPATGYPLGTRVMQYLI